MSADKDQHAAPTEPSAFIFYSYKHMVPPGPGYFLPQSGFARKVLRSFFSVQPLCPLCLRG